MILLDDEQISIVH